MNIQMVEAKEIESLEKKYYSIASDVLSDISSLENVDLSISFIESMNDINGDKNYVLLHFNEGGYAVANNNGVISEYNLEYTPHPYQTETNSVKVYAGPLN